MTTEVVSVRFEDTSVVANLFQLKMYDFSGFAG